MVTGVSNMVGSEQLRILVADDSPVSRRLVEQALEQEPYMVLFAENGRQALQKISDSQPHIVITDWMRLISPALTCAGESGESQMRDTPTSFCSPAVRIWTGWSRVLPPEPMII